jgi:hypothetical protein
MSIKYGHQFISSKLEELSLLSSLTKTSFPDFNSQKWDYPAFIEHKFKLMQHLRSDFIKQITEPVTKRTPATFQWGDMTYQYLYQRQGISISLGEKLISYPINKSSESIFEFFTTSGQSAGLCVFEFIKNEFPKATLLALKNNTTYYESNDVIKLCNIPSSKEGKCFFYDGSFNYSFNWLLEILKDIDLFVFDTTLFPYGSKQLQEILDHLMQKRIPTLLIRSHLKLDSLGAEFSSLGSIAALNMERLPTLETNRSSKVALAKYLSTTGSYASIDQIYPFLGNPQFIKIAKTRAERTQQLGTALTEQLQELIKEKDYSVSIIKTWHSHYFYLKYPSSEEISMQNEFEKLKLVTEIPAFFCDSFGFDFLTLTCVPILESTSNSYMYRFSVPDMEIESIEFIIDFFSTFLKKLNEKLLTISG